jgi:hypothetical protein
VSCVDRTDPQRLADRVAHAEHAAAIAEAARPSLAAPAAGPSFDGGRANRRPCRRPPTKPR